ncbi:MAG: hypothetical protein ACT4PX_07485 [Actinomycetota bacterium]
MDLREKRALYNGFGDTLTRAVEFVAIPGVFAVAGRLVDDRIGTTPLLTLLLAALALVGVFVRAYFAYEVAMREQEAQRPWNRSAKPAGGRP